MSLYDSLHNVLVKLNSNEKTRHLRIAVDVDKNNILGKVYSIRITDDDEPVFLYSVLMGEEDFNVIKTQQGLRADFESFPNHLVKKLEDCLNNRGQFYLVLDDFDVEDSNSYRSNSFIKIIERSDFKDTCLLRLRIAPGTEEDIRALMCSKINLINSRYLQKDKECQGLSCENQKMMIQLQDQERKISELELRLSEEVHAVKTDLSEKFRNEKNKWFDDFKDTENQLFSQIKELETRVALLDFKNRGLNEEKKELENTLGIRSMKLEMAEKELQRCAETTSQLINENTLHNERIRDLNDKLASSLNLKAELEKDNAQMARIISDKDREVTMLRESDRKLKVQIEQLEREKKKIKEEWLNVNNDVNELRREIVYTNEKKKSLLEVAELLESQKESLMEELKTASTVISTLEEKLQNAGQELLGSQKKISELETVVAAHEKEIKKQVDVNTFLHRKLNDKGGVGGNMSAPDPPVDITRINVSATNANRTLPPWLTASSTTEKDEADSGQVRKNNKSSAYFPAVTDAATR